MMYLLSTANTNRGVTYEKMNKIGYHFSFEDLPYLHYPR